MKSLLIILSIMLLQQNAFAKKGEIPTEADYVVPTSAEFVPFSRFKIQIVQPYEGISSTSISYIFPAELTGVPNYKITLNRVGNTDTWESPEVKAVCVESSELFSCNIYVNRAEDRASEGASLRNGNSTKLKMPLEQLASARSCGGSALAMAASTEFTGTFIDETNLKSFFQGTGITGSELDGKMAVARAFACSEPIGGILSYEFK